MRLAPSLAVFVFSTCTLAACGAGSDDITDGDAATSGGSNSGGATSGSGGSSTGGQDAGSGGSGTGGETHQPSGPRVMGYILSLDAWGGPSALDQLDFSAVDYVIHAFYTADTQNQVIGVNEDTAAYRSAGIVGKVHAAGKRILMSLGGANHSFELKQIAANATRIPPFVANVITKINEYGYDGVDLDMEFPAGGQEPQHHLALMSALYDAVKANNPEHLAMFGVSPGYYLNQFEWSQLGAKSDYAFYFCYDWNMPANGPMTNPGTSFNMLGGEALGEASCRAALDYMVAGGYAASQIIVGLPFYANGGAQYSTIPAHLKTAAPDPNYMEVSDGNGGWWPTATSTVMKIDAVLEPSKSVLSGQATVAGIGYWEWGYENPAAPELSRAIKQRVIDTR